MAFQTTSRCGFGLICKNRISSIFCCHDIQKSIGLCQKMDLSWQAEHMLQVKQVYSEVLPLAFVHRTHGIIYLTFSTAALTTPGQFRKISETQYFTILVSEHCSFETLWIFLCMLTSFQMKETLIFEAYIKVWKGLNAL